MNVGRQIWRLIRVTRLAVHTDDDAGKVARSKEYNHAKQRVILIGMFVSIAGGAAFIASGLPKRISDRIGTNVSNKWVRRSVFALAIGAIDTLMSLPLGYFSGYVLEHRYDLSNQSRTAWMFEQVKGAMVALPFTAFAANLMLELVDRWPKRWWAITTALAVPFTVLLSQLAPVLIMPLFNRFEPLKDTELAARLKALAASSGVNVANVMQMDMSRQTKKANAFFAGIGRTKRIVLADTLLDNFSPDEIETVVAHEVGHQANKDIWRFIALGTVFTAGVSWAVDFLASRIVRQYGEQIGISRLSDETALPLMSWLLSIVAVSVGPIQNAYSRHIERRADTFALELTHKPKAFEKAMTRLGDMNLSDPNPSAFVKYTMYSHPPIPERIDRARRFAQEHK